MDCKTKYIVNLSNLAHNVNTIRGVVGKKVKICAIVKANAYGLGLKAVVKKIESYVDYFGVASVVEAKELRKINKHTPVLILGEVNLSECKWCANNNVCVTVSALSELNAICNMKLQNPVMVHLAVNTGLNRIGFDDIRSFKRALDICENSTKIKLVGCFTHFATKSADIAFIDTQFKVFKKYIKLLPKGVIVHCANSFATFYNHKLHCDMVRPGFALYGEHKCDYSLKSVLSIKSEIIHITNVSKGQSVGYDRTFVAPNNMRVAVVPIGYADGLDRRLSNNFYLLVDGKRAPIVGNICMDVTLIDVTHIKCADIGSSVTIMGNSGDEVLRPETYANILGTSPYEVLLKFNYKRMKYITLDE